MFEVLEHNVRRFEFAVTLSGSASSQEQSVLGETMIVPLLARRKLRELMRKALA